MSKRRGGAVSNQQSVLITGAGSGLGKALSQTFAAAGYLVFAGDILFQEDSSHPGIQQMELDVTSKESIQILLKQVSGQVDKLDLLINNAGVAYNFPLAETDPEQVFDMLNVNSMGSLRMVHHFLPLLLKANGKVITISSESIAIPGAFQPYQVTKIALEGLHKTLRQELLIKGIRMISIRPGAINTPLLSQVKELRPHDYLIFKKEFDKFRIIAPKYIGKAMEPATVAQKILRISQKKRPRYVYNINHDPLRKLIAFLPERLRDYLVKFRLTKM